MKTAKETVTVLAEGLTLDLILWRKFRQPVPGILEKTLERNQGLAKLGVWLPVGTKFVIPAVDLEEAAKASNVVVLWE